jgi:hypothetical protein
MFLLFRPVDMTYLMSENPNDRDIPETLVCLELQNSVIGGRELSGARRWSLNWSANRFLCVTFQFYRDLWKILSEIDMLGKYSIAYPLVQTPIGVGYSGAKLPGFDLHNTSSKGWIA